ncbi:hypothetical protein OSTOST_02034 [Ostertagia ostertagi]
MLFNQLTNKRTLETTPESQPHEEARLDEGLQTVSTSTLVEVKGPQERREERSQLRSSINMKISVLQSRMNTLVNTDSEQAKEVLVTIGALVDKASKIGQITTTGIAARPELTKRGAKPKQSKVQLYTLSCCDMPFNCPVIRQHIL